MAHLKAFEENLRNLVDCEWKRVILEAVTDSKDSAESPVRIPTTDSDDDKSSSESESDNSGAVRKRKSRSNPKPKPDSKKDRHPAPFKYRARCCGIEFKYIGFAIQHVVTCQADKELAAIKCHNRKPKKFIERIDYLDNAGEFSHACRHCPYRSNNAGNMITHQNTYHTGEKRS
jgi:hypothetical protein